MIDTLNQVDLAFVVDTTGSMGAFIGAARQHMIALLRSLADGTGFRGDGFRNGSRWVLRMGDETDRYVHVHPARWVPETCRVRANVLKTAVMVLAHIGIRGGDPMERARVNAVRAEYLCLAPIGRDISGTEGLGAVMKLLRSE